MMVVTMAIRRGVRWLRARVRVGTNVDKGRRDQRLEYVVARYSAKTPYWQFVVWARQVGLAVITVALRQMTSLPQSVLMLGELLLLVLLQHKFKPYPQPRQNVLELGGYVVHLFIVVFGMVTIVMKALSCSSPGRHG